MIPIPDLLRAEALYPGRVAKASAPGHQPWAVAAFVLGAGMVVAYVILIWSQGSTPLIDVVPWALLMTVPAIAVLVAAKSDDLRLARRLLLGAAAVFGLLGAVSILSIGLGFLLIAVIATVAAVRLKTTSTEVSTV